MKALTDYDIESLREQFAAWGCKPAQAQRILLDFYRNHGHVDLPRLELGRTLLGHMRREIAACQSHVRARRESADGTVKLLLGFERGGAVEAVLMPTRHGDRMAGCVSSQIGCAMGCAFCATGAAGFERDLSAGEMVEQFLHLKEQAAAAGRRLATVVFMGMGEPLLNLDNVVLAINRIAGRGMGDVGWKQIMVSTVGVVPGIKALAQATPNVTLALSLHAPDDETRSKLIPLNRRYGVREVVAATRWYHETTGRITNIEYCLIDGVNDSDAQAHALAKLLDGFHTHVNLIACNATSGPYAAPPFARQRAFLHILRAAGIMAHLRQPRGQDIEAACGQLRAALSLPAAVRPVQ